MTRHHPLPRPDAFPDTDVLNRGERIERTALKGLHGCATPGMRRDLKLVWRETPGATASIAAALPASAIVLNRAFLSPEATIAEAASPIGRPASRASSCAFRKTGRPSPASLRGTGSGRPEPGRSSSASAAPLFRTPPLWRSIESHRARLARRRRESSTPPSIWAARPKPSSPGSWGDDNWQVFLARVMASPIPCRLVRPGHDRTRIPRSGCPAGAPAPSAPYHRDSRVRARPNLHRCHGPR
jgi:hypothetical protein